MKFKPGLLFLIILLSIAGCKKEKEDIIEEPLSLAKVQTLSIKQIGRLFKCTGAIIDSGNLQIIEKGICWDILPFPRVNKSKKITDISPNQEDRYSHKNFTIKLNDLDYDKTYYVRAYATNSNGTTYGDVLKLATPPISMLAVGDNFGGGKVAYIFAPGDIGYICGEIHGIIAAEFDLEEEYNFKDALSICENLNLNGYSDWHLPSYHEFKLVLKNIEVISGLKEGQLYRSSTWDASSGGWGTEDYPWCFMMILKWNHYFTYDWMPFDNKLYVRPVRLF